MTLELEIETFSHSVNVIPSVYQDQTCIVIVNAHEKGFYGFSARYYSSYSNEVLVNCYGYVRKGLFLSTKYLEGEM